MDKTTKKLSGEESLRLITEMIETAKGDFRDSSFYFLLWGWIVLAGSLGHYSLYKFTTVSMPHLAWLVMIIGMVISPIYSIKQGKKEGKASHITRIYMWIWMAFLINYFIVLFFMSKINYHITPLVILLAGSTTFLSGIIIKFKPLVIGGIIMWALVIVAFLVSRENQLLISALSMASYLVPGYILKAKYKK